MSSLHGVEELFKIRHEFKECARPKHQAPAPPCDSSEDSAAKVAELIRKLKGQGEPFSH